MKGNLWFGIPPSNSSLHLSDVDILKSKKINFNLRRRGEGLGKYMPLGDKSTVYKGEIKDGLPHGKGKLSYSKNAKVRKK